MVKKATWWQTALLAVFAALLIFAAWEIEQVGDHLQYLIPAPTPTISEENTQAAPPNGQIAALSESLTNAAEEWQEIMACWTLTGVKERADFAGGAAAAQGRLTLMGENGLLLHPLYLRSGRLFHPEEIENGDRVIILDEQLALEIFRVSAPIDRDVVVNGEAYRVIGIARHQKQVGDLMDYGAYIPLNSVISSDMALDALLVEAQPLKGVGAAVSFRSVVNGWFAGGTVIDLGKEGMAAGLWLRVLVFLAGMTVVLRLIRWLNVRAGAALRGYQRNLQSKYAIRLLPELMGGILLFALGYGVAAALVAGVMNYIIQPVYTFTEWIPAVLVEWDEIAIAFWKVWQTPAVLTEMRSPELLRLRWLTLMIQGSAAAAAVLLALRWAKLRTAREQVSESLRALYRQGVTTAWAQADQPAAMADAGYVLLEEFRLARIINVRRALTGLKPPVIEGSFVLEITDDRIPENNLRWKIDCKQGRLRLTETRKEWDVRMSATALTKILCGKQSFSAYMEWYGECTLRVRLPLMDALFDAAPLSSDDEGE